MIKNILEYSVFVLFIGIAKLFGIKRIHHLANILAFIFYRIIPIRKNVVVENLKKAFPEKSNTEIEELTKKNYYSFAKTFSELLLLQSTKDEILKNMCSAKNEKVFYEEYEKGRGVLLMSAHFGNWEFGAVWLNLFLGFGVTGLAKKQRNKYMANWLSRTRKRFGNKEIFTGKSFIKIVKALKNKEIIGIVGDQRGRKNSERIKFFGRDTAVFTGSAAIAVKLNYPIILAFVVRQDDGTYLTEFERIECTNFNLSEEERVLALTQKYFERLEIQVRKHPEQWFWMHNIWKF